MHQNRYKINKGETFNIDQFNFNYSKTYLQFINNDGKFLGLFKRENFMKVSDYRNRIIKSVIDGE